MNSHLSKTEYRIMEYFWSTGGKYTFGELMKYFNEEEDKNWKKQTLNTFLSRLIDKGLLERKKEETKAYYGAALTKAEFKQRKAKAILEEKGGIEWMAYVSFVFTHNICSFFRFRREDFFFV